MPFLLPSLNSALSWVGNLIQDDPTSAGVLLEVLIKRPEELDSQEIHQTILAMFAPQLKKEIQSTQPQDAMLGSIVKALDQCPEFFLASEDEEQPPSSQLLTTLQNHIITLITSMGSLDLGGQSVGQTIPAMVHRAIQVRGVDVALRCLIGVLLQLSSSHDFLFALDVVATIICTTGHGLSDAMRVQYNTLGPLLKKGDTLSAEAIVRLHRQVEAYTSLLTVQDMGLDSIAFAPQLTDIDTANPNLDGTASMAGAMDLQTEQSQADGIDQVLDEVAAMGNMESNDADMSFDALYGLQNTDMDDLNDLDLDMF